MCTHPCTELSGRCAVPASLSGRPQPVQGKQGGGQPTKPHRSLAELPPKEAEGQLNPITGCDEVLQNGGGDACVDHRETFPPKRHRSGLQEVEKQLSAAKEQERQINDTDSTTLEDPQDCSLSCLLSSPVVLTLFTIGGKGPHQSTTILRQLHSKGVYSASYFLSPSFCTVRIHKKRCTKQEARTHT